MSKLCTNFVRAWRPSGTNESLVGHRQVRVGRTRGVTLVEVIIGLSLLTTIIATLGGVLISVQSAQDQGAMRESVRRATVSLLEEIRATEPSAVEGSYHGLSRTVDGVTGAQGDGSVLTVRVDPSNPKLLEVTVSAAWVGFGSTTEELTMSTLVYNP